MKEKTLYGHLQSDFEMPPYSERLVKILPLNSNQ